MRIIYKGSLVFISFLIGICIFIGIAYFFYDNVISDDTEVVVVDSLSINYLNGRSIRGNGEYAFSITNSDSKDISFDILINELKGYDEKLIYSLSSKEANLNINNYNLEENNFAIGEALLIKAGETQNFILNISNNTSTSFKLKIGVNNEIVEYFYNTILKDNKINKNSATKVGEEIAVTNEGLIEDIDDYGTTYYFRGLNNNNYVSFAGLTWRIVRINGNGTVRLILDNVASELANYSNTLADIDNIKEAAINNILHDYYQTYLKNYDDYVAKSKFCHEIEYVSSDDEKVYNPYSRVYTNNIPTFNCLGEKYTSKIGLLTVDEVIYAGANFGDNNKDYYLYNKEIEELWWTSNLAKSDEENFYPFAISKDGKIIYNTNGSLYRSLRPIINLNKKVIVSGTGTLEDPYTINQ